MDYSMIPVRVISERIPKEPYRLLWSIPLYNEAENVERLVGSLCEAQAAVQGGLLVCFVENGSTDGTTTALASALLRPENQDLPHIVVSAELDARCVGVPRAIGFTVGLRTLEQREYSIDEHLFLIASDANAFPQRGVPVDTEMLLGGGYDACLFRIRFDLDYFRRLFPDLSRIVEILERIAQLEQGLNDLMAEEGVTKVRGKGYAVRAEVYKRIGGIQQPFSKTGVPLKGESHSVGTRLRRAGAKITYAASGFIVTPRRLLAEAYADGNPYREVEDGVIYEPFRPPERPPTLDYCRSMVNKRSKSFAMKVVKMLIFAGPSEQTRRRIGMKYIGDVATAALEDLIARRPELLQIDVSGVLNTDTDIRTVVDLAEAFVLIAFK